MMYNRMLNQEFKKYVPYLKYVHFSILIYLYSWVCGNNPPKMRQFENDDKLYFYIYLDKITQDTGFSRGQVERALYRLENKDKKIKTTMQPFIYPKQVKKENRLYISLNPIMADFLISDEFKVSKEKLNKRLTGNTFYVKKLEDKKYNENMSDMIFDVEENKRVYSDEAEMIAKRIISKYHHIFPHRVPDGGKVTKTFEQICVKIQDIYDGRFNSRKYPISEKCLNSKQFNTDNYQIKLKEVKGDWNKVRKLLFSCLKNFELMHDDDRMPFRKDYLQSNLNLWFYDKFSNPDEPQSQFIQSINEPLTTGRQLSENKADKYFEKLSNSAQIGANRLYNMAPKSTPAGTFFKNAYEMVEWAKNAFDFEDKINIRDWISSPSEILNSFADYCDENGISVSCNTIDIDKSVSTNSPWVWFVKNASLKHGLNLNLCDCVTVDDFNDCYNYGGF